MLLIESENSGKLEKRKSEKIIKGSEDYFSNSEKLMLEGSPLERLKLKEHETLPRNAFIFYSKGMYRM